MIKIRLQRKGRIRRPIYHIVVADSRSPRDGRIIEQVGRFDGVTEKKETILNEDRIMYWLDTGAQPTDSVRKILRTEGILYKRHLKMWGKSDEEIEAAMEEWKAYRDSKKGDEVTRRDQVKAALAAEEKEYKKQVEKKAATAAAEVASEQEDVAEAEEVEAEVAEEVTEEAPAAEEVVEETTEEAAAEEETTEDEAPAEEEAKEEPKEEAPVEEAPAEETKEEEVAEEPAEEAKEEEAAKTSVDMTAKEAADHISNTDLADLDGFVTEAEERKTVLAAWEAKKAD
ncbi:MAG: 30S ribosomal protein S16 [bacterium]|nr:30S ribosomal protein S16 [bacterium]